MTYIILANNMQIKLTPIIPKPLNVSMMKQQFINAMRDVGEEIRENFDDTVKTWNKPPRWEPASLVPKVGIDVIAVETSTEDKKYGWVSEGTESHPIFPRNAKTLAFPGRFIPKTFPGIINSGPGFSGPVDEFRNWVAHPGVEARKFDKEIAQKMEKNFKISIQRAMALASRASGHRMP